MAEQRRRRRRLKKEAVQFAAGMACAGVALSILAGVNLSNNMKETKDLKTEMKTQEEQVSKLEENIKAEETKQVELVKQEADVQKELSEQAKTNPNILNVSQEKVAYLTFDDGPSKNTSIILDFLKANNIKATFFVLGNGDDALYKRIVDEGHTLAPHSNTHDYATIYQNKDAFMEDLNSLSAHLEKVTGVKPTITRLPGGSVNSISKKYGGDNIMEEVRQAVTDAGYTYFDWNVDSKDAATSNQSEEVIIQSVLDGTKNLNEAVILMHDAAPKGTTVDALPEIVEGLKAQGFVFRPITKETTPVQYK